MIDLFALWSHLLAACLYGALALWQLRHWRAEPLTRPLVTGFAVVSVWAIFMALLGPFHLLSQLADCARHLAFLAFMYGLMRHDEPGALQRPVKAVYAVVSAAVALQIVLAGLIPRFAAEAAVVAAMVPSVQMIGLAVAAGALVLVHNVYGQAAPQSRGAIRLPMAALAAMWFYDLHLNTSGYLSRDLPGELYSWRGAVMALLAGLFAFGMRRTDRLKIQLSRVATFQSLSVLAILFYLILMMSTSRAVELAGGNWLEIAQVALLVAMSVAAFILVPSAKARRWVSVTLQKHLFQHRYDYRQEWLRFTATVASEAAPLEQRVAKAIAEIGGAPAGLLLMRSDERLVRAGQWNWPADAAEAVDCAELIAFLEKDAHIIDFADAQSLPAGLADLPQAWAGIPLIHANRLQGLVVIAHPPLRRALDWEDFDLFRAAGRQAASYLAEARSLEALAEARRFDEFNRRFAFILHDIKNLVSQLKLVARNAERHADNPEFRADMVATLQSSVRKMNDLLARLAPGARAQAGLSPRPLLIQPLLAALAEARRRQRAVTVAGDARLMAIADPAALEQAVGHLVQNAIDASGGDQPVRIGFRAVAGRIEIDIADEGRGMTPDFVATRLFQPFVSTKDGGFGIGAHEARSLVEAMCGTVKVASRPGGGTVFTLSLPAAAPVTLVRSEKLSA